MFGDEMLPRKGNGSANCGVCWNQLKGNFFFLTKSHFKNQIPLPFLRTTKGYASPKMCQYSVVVHIWLKSDRLWWGPAHPSCVVNHTCVTVLCPPTQGICGWIEHSLPERCSDSCQDAEGFQLLFTLVGREEMQNLIWDPCFAIVSHLKGLFLALWKK